MKFCTAASLRLRINSNYFSNKKRSERVAFFVCGWGWLILQKWWFQQTQPPFQKSIMASNSYWDQSRYRQRQNQPYTLLATHTHFPYLCP
jgi:hypothetical protein